MIRLVSIFRASSTFCCGLLLIVSLIARSESVSQVNYLSQDALAGKISQGELLAIIDVRSAFEFSRGHLPSAIHIPHSALVKDASLIDAYADHTVVFYCHSGVRVRYVIDYLRSQGKLNVYHLKGDYRVWRANGRPIEK